jgi:hypothetical protein
MALRQAAFADLHGEKGDVIERRYSSNCKCRFQNLCYSTTKTFFAIYLMQNSILILFYNSIKRSLICSAIKILV